MTTQRIDKGSSGAPKAGRSDGDRWRQGLMKQPDVMLEANAATESIPPVDQTTERLPRQVERSLREDATA